MAGDGQIQVNLTLNQVEYEKLAIEAGLTAEAFRHWWNSPELRAPMSALVVASTQRTNEAAKEALKPLVLQETAALKKAIVQEFDKHRHAIGLGRFITQLQGWANQIFDQNKYAMKAVGINSAAEFFEQAARIKFGLVKAEEVECDCPEGHCDPCYCPSVD